MEWETSYGCLLLQSPTTVAYCSHPLWYSYTLSCQRAPEIPVKLCGDLHLCEDGSGNFSVWAESWGLLGDWGSGGLATLRDPTFFGQDNCSR